MRFFAKIYRKLHVFDEKMHLYAMENG